jgi:redox-sensitive bicupin YhaK (pirin superfamily)
MREATLPGMGAPLEQVVVPHVRDLGGLTVGRVLPQARCRSVGPFVFLDRMGPARFAPGQGLDVRPHPHIGLATITYLFEGAIVHRDSLGIVQTIRPGEVNWMTAGRGIVHSERSDAELRRAAQALDGVQAWVALPEGAEEIEPSFEHHPVEALPRITGPGTSIVLIAGSLHAARSPVRTASALVYADVALEAGASLPLGAEHRERGLYLIAGSVQIAGDAEAASEPFTAGPLLVLAQGAPAVVRAREPARLLLLGGDPLGERHLWWNFVSSRRERIEQAKADWEHDRFAVVPGETERIPLPRS